MRLYLLLFGLFLVITLIVYDLVFGFLGLGFWGGVEVDLVCFVWCVLDDYCVFISLLGCLCICYCFELCGVVSFGVVLLLRLGDAGWVCFGFRV